jgi:hypothetical protein
MSIHAVTGLIAQPTNTIAATSTAVDGSFANILNQTGVIQPKNASIPTTSSSAIVAASLPDQPVVDSLFEGDGYDSATHSINIELLAQAAQKRLATFAAEFKNALQNAGINNNQNMSLSVGYDGSIVVKGNSPDKACIEQMFKDNPALGNDFRTISAENFLVAEGRLASQYYNAWQNTSNDHDRLQVYNHFHSLFEQLGKVNGMEFSNGTIASDAINWVNQLTA